jgi:hypothetical protein
MICSYHEPCERRRANVSISNTPRKYLPENGRNNNNNNNNNNNKNIFLRQINTHPCLFIYTIAFDVHGREGKE